MAKQTNVKALYEEHERKWKHYSAAAWLTFFVSIVAAAALPYNGKLDGKLGVASIIIVALFLLAIAFWLISRSHHDYVFDVDNETFQINQDADDERKMRQERSRLDR